MEIIFLIIDSSIYFIGIFKPLVNISILLPHNIIIFVFPANETLTLINPKKTMRKKRDMKRAIFLIYLSS